MATTTAVLPSSLNAFKRLQPHFTDLEFAFSQWGSEEEYYKMLLSLKHLGDKDNISFSERGPDPTGALQIPFLNLRESPDFSFEMTLEPSSSHDWHEQVRWAVWKKVNPTLCGLKAKLQLVSFSQREDLRGFIDDYKEFQFTVKVLAPLPGLHLPPSMYLSDWRSFFPRSANNELGGLCLRLIERLITVDDILWRSQPEQQISGVSQYGESDVVAYREAAQQYVDSLRRRSPDLHAALLQS